MRLSKTVIMSTVGLFALVQAGNAAAQTPTETVVSAEDQAQGAGEEVDTSGIADIVVTARKISESAQRVPLSIIALGPEQIENSGIQNVQDLQSQAPNLILQTHPTDPQSLSLAMRGQKQVDLTLTLDPSVGVYVDGFYNPRSLGLRGALVDMARVEVLRGPQGTLYGRNTTGGALALYTNDPVDRFEGMAQASRGNYNAWEVVGVANIPMTEGLALRLVAQHNEHDGYGKDSLGRPLLEENATYVRGKLRAELGERVTLTAMGSYTDSESSGAIVKLTHVRPATNGGVAVSDFSTAVRGVAAELGLAPTPANLRIAQARLDAFVGSPSGRFYDTNGAFAQASKTKIYTAGLDITGEISDAISIRSLTGYMGVDRLARTDTDATPFNIVGGPRTTIDNYYSQELQLLGSSDALNWVIGGYYGMERGVDITVSDTVPFLSPTSPTIFDATVRNRSLAAFAQGVWEFAPRARLTVGGRYSWDNRVLISANRNRLSPCVVPAPGFDAVTASPVSRQCPRTFVDKYSDPSYLVSLDYELNDDILVYAKTARGYRSGGRNFKGSNNIGTFIAFDPETVTEYEVGLKSYFFDRRVRFNLAVYYDKYNDVQKVATIVLPVTNTFSSQTVNAAKARVQGFEADILWRVTDAFTLNGAVGLVDGKYKDFQDLSKGDRSNEPFDVPKWTFNVGGRYEVETGLGMLGLQVDYQWQDKFYLDPQNYRIVDFRQPARGLLSARASLDIDSVDAKIAFFGRNLTNKQYLSSGASPYDSLGLNFAVTGEPRIFGIEFTKRFGDK